MRKTKTTQTILSLQELPTLQRTYI